MPENTDLEKMNPMNNKLCRESQYSRNCSKKKTFNDLQ